MWRIKNAIVFYYEAKIMIEMQKELLKELQNYRKELLTRCGVYILRDFKGVINRLYIYT